MKKFFLTAIAVFSVCLANAQINNLKDLIIVSNLSPYGLVERLQGKWEIHQPGQELSEGNRVATEIYTFSYNKGNKKQILQRTVKGNLISGIKREATGFISNDLELYKLITSNLKYQGFVLKEKNQKSDVSMYSDGNVFIIVNPKFSIKKGLYKITVGIP